MHQNEINPCKVTFSLVVYKQPVEELRRVIRSLQLYPHAKILYVVDNSPTDEARSLTELDPSVIYHFNNKNIGFGQAHNWAIREAMKRGSEYHFVVNPDITFDEDVVTPMIDWLDTHPDVGQMMPRILFPDGRKQYLPKLMPSPLRLLQRRLRGLFPAKHTKWMQSFEMRSMRDDKVYDVGHVSGCFSVARVSALRECGLYDDRFFMYFEDTDLSRRMHAKYRTVYFPLVSVFHGYGNAASKDPRIFFIFLSSLFKYFNKWGWLFDTDRKQCNRAFLEQIDLSAKEQNQ